MSAKPSGMHSMQIYFTRYAQQQSVRLSACVYQRICQNSKPLHAIRFCPVYACGICVSMSFAACACAIRASISKKQSRTAALFEIA